MAARHYQELMVWQKAIELVVLIYQTTTSFPREEQFGLTIQLRKAAISIPSNIAEGQGRNTRGASVQPGIIRSRGCLIALSAPQREDAWGFLSG